jgi:ABC-type methionine transport system permease subunit
MVGLSRCKVHIDRMASLHIMAIMTQKKRQLRKKIIWILNNVVDFFFCINVQILLVLLPCLSKLVLFSYVAYELLIEEL